MVTAHLKPYQFYPEYLGWMRNMRLFIRSDFFPKIDLTETIIPQEKMTADIFLELVLVTDPWLQISLIRRSTLTVDSVLTPPAYCWRFINALAANMDIKPIVLEYPIDGHLLFNLASFLGIFITGSIRFCHRWHDNPLVVLRYLVLKEISEWLDMKYI